MDNPFKGLKVGLALSGGGMRGMAHIGVLKAMEEFGIEVEIVSGTSMGALIGSMHCANISANDMLNLFESISIFSFRNYSYNQPGLINTLRFKKYFIERFYEDSFEHLSKRLYINSTNILTGKHKVFSEGELFLPVLSSIAYPGVFTPVEINGELFADGGITNNFPIEPIQWECDILIGSYVNPLRKIERSQIKNSFSMVERTMQISMYTMEVNSFHLADVFIMPKELINYPMFSLKNIHAVYELGYNEAKRILTQYFDTK